MADPHEGPGAPRFNAPEEEWRTDPSSRSRPCASPLLAGCGGFLVATSFLMALALSSQASGLPLCVAWAAVAFAIAACVIGLLGRGLVPRRYGVAALAMAVLLGWLSVEPFGRSISD